MIIFFTTICFSETIARVRKSTQDQLRAKKWAQLKEKRKNKLPTLSYAEKARFKAKMDKEKKQYQQYLENIKKERRLRDIKIEKQRIKEEERKKNRTPKEIYNEEFKNKYIVMNNKTYTMDDFCMIFVSKVVVHQIVNNYLFLGKIDQNESVCAIEYHTKNIIDDDILYLPLITKGRFQYNTVLGAKKTVKKYILLDYRPYSFADYKLHKQKFDKYIEK